MVFVNAEWITDHKAALTLAGLEKKLVLLHFTGSDWCGFCRRLDTEVLNDASFRDLADKNYVLVTVDFPQSKDLPADRKLQNDALAKHYRIGRFPTLVVLNSDGRELSRQEGYRPGSGPGAIVAELARFNP